MHDLLNMPNTRLTWMILGMVAVMSVGTAVRLVALRGKEPELIRKRLGSLRTWWMIVSLLVLAAVLGKLGATLLLATASYLGVREYVRLIAPSATDRPLVLMAYATVPINYLLIYFEQHEAFLVFLPLAALFLFSSWKTLSGRTSDYIGSTAGLHWGVLLIVYGLSHTVLLFDLPEEMNPVAGNAGWFLYLVVMTETNDIAQAIVGRKFGRHKITPVVSPNKSWEGLVGGVIITTILALVLAGLLTPLTDESILLRNGAVVSTPYALALMSGLLISLAGFLGDLNMSAIKRDVGVKDGSAMLPGQGGVIDRIDSLTFTAPVFYYFIKYCG